MTNKDGTHSSKFVDDGQNIEDEKNFLPIIFVATVVIILGLVAYRVFQPCPSGRYKSNLILCKFYRTFGDVPVDDFAQKEFKYAGSTSLLKLADPIRQTIAQVHDNFILDLKELDTNLEGETIAWSGEGIQELIEGKIDIAFSSRDLIDVEIEEASQKGFKLESIPIAKSGLTFFISEQNAGTILNLTLEQIRRIYTEQDFSPINREVKPFSPDPLNEPERPEYFQKEVLGGEEFSSNVVNFSGGSSITGLIAQVVSVEEIGIGFADASLICPQEAIVPIGIESNGTVFLPCVDGNPRKPHNITIADGSYPLTRELFVIIRRDGTTSEKAGEAYANMILSDEGQEIVEQVGYVSIRDK